MEKTQSGRTGVNQGRGVIGPRLKFLRGLTGRSGLGDQSYAFSIVNTIGWDSGLGQAKVSGSPALSIANWKSDLESAL